MANIFANGEELLTTTKLENALANPNLAYGVIKDNQHVVQNGSTKNFSYKSADDRNWNFYYFPLSVSFKKGDIFTISAYGTLTGSQSDGFYKAAIYSESFNTNYDDTGDSIFFKSGEFSSKTVTVNADSNPDDPPVVLIYSGKPGKTGGNTITVKNLKVEKGAIPTMWLPAPQDQGLVTRSDFDALQAKIDSLTKNQK